ncbi:hypothetical protein [Botrimarina sp.]|uniref:hypothetical protein n=1 Tax=Botrimarina sp. TaxID=2795802 RepID=UPI0032EF0386
MSHSPTPTRPTPPPSTDESRRAFLRGAAAVGGLCLAPPTGAFASRRPLPDSVARYLKEHTVPRETVDRFLDPDARVWARFHPTYGYLLRDAFVRDGVDGARTLGRYGRGRDFGGPRRQVNFPDAPCRINTYGDSFTQGHQVSDGETWQEVLAAHFCEPVRNWGIGGFGVYQACRRMRDVEASDMAASHLVLNIWGDDHHRSVYAWRWLSFPTEVLSSMTGVMFHANPWVHARLTENGDLDERPNLCPTPESLYDLCDTERVIDLFGNDDVTHALVAANTGRLDDADALRRLADAGGVGSLDLGDDASRRRAARHVMNRYAIAVGKLVVADAARLAQSSGKRLMVLLSHPSGSVWRHCAGETAEEAGEVDWHPTDFTESVRRRGLPVVDTVEAHVEDFARFRGTPKEYVDRYYIGHYTPTGNHFFAYAVKDQMVAWLNPLPPSYAGAGDETLLRFEGYLPE